MIQKSTDTKIQKFKILHPLLFFTAGVVGGLLGSGGGILVVLALKHLIKYKQDKKTIFATSMAIILPMSAISSVIYSRSTAIDFYSISHYILPGCVGGIGGAMLFGKMNFKILNLIFSLLVIFAGFIMIF